jgi:Bacterial SCP ortholog
MPARRRIDPIDGLAAIERWRQTPDHADRELIALAVRYSLEELAARYPGRSTEVRVPPFAAVQCIQGPRHTRGTPPNVVEADPQTWLGLVTGSTGTTGWSLALANGTLRASGERSDLSALLPLFSAPPG